MNALVRAEVLKLRTARSTIALIAVVSGLGLLLVARVVGAAGSAGGVTPGTADAWTQVLGAALSPTLLLLLVGVLAFTAELRHGSLTPTLLVTPDRGRLVLAKVLASALVGIALTAVLTTAAAGIGAATGVLTTAPDVQVLRLVVSGMLLASLWAWLGVAVGVLVRQQIPALVLPLVWLLVGETLVTAYGLADLRWWLPGGAASGLSGADLPGVLPAPLAALVLAGYAVVLTVPGLARLTHVDVT